MVRNEGLRYRRRMIDAERVRRRIEALGLTPRYVSLRAFGNPDSVRSLLRGGQVDVKGQNKLRLAAALGCGTDYLDGLSPVIGKPPRVDLFDAPAPRPRKRKGVLVPAGRKFTELIAQPDDPDLVHIAEYDVRISAGPGQVVTEENVRRFWGLPRAFIESIGLDVNHIAFVEIAGDSMAPTLQSGDLVLLDLRSKNPALPAIYALFDSEATVCKRVERVPMSDPPVFRLISDNERYSPYEVPAEWVNVIGRVAWFSRRI